MYQRAPGSACFHFCCPKYHCVLPKKTKVLVTRFTYTRGSESEGDSDTIISDCKLLSKSALSMLPREVSASTSHSQSVSQSLLSSSSSSSISSILWENTNPYDDLISRLIRALNCVEFITSVELCPLTYEVFPE